VQNISHQPRSKLRPDLRQGLFSSFLLDQLKVVLLVFWVVYLSTHPVHTTLVLSNFLAPVIVSNYSLLAVLDSDGWLSAENTSPKQIFP